MYGHCEFAPTSGPLVSLDLRVWRPQGRRASPLAPKVTRISRPSTLSKTLV